MFTSLGVPVSEFFLADSSLTFFFTCCKHLCKYILRGASAQAFRTAWRQLQSRKASVMFKFHNSQCCRKRSRSRTCAASFSAEDKQNTAGTMRTDGRLFFSCNRPSGPMQPNKRPSRFVLYVKSMTKEWSPESCRMACVLGHTNGMQTSLRADHMLLDDANAGWRIRKEFLQLSQTVCGKLPIFWPARRSLVLQLTDIRTMRHRHPILFHLQKRLGRRMLLRILRCILLLHNCRILATTLSSYFHHELSLLGSLDTKAPHLGTGLAFLAVG